MVGTNIGAGQRDRALRAAWIGAGIAAGLTEVIGLSAAAFPHAWLSLFDTDPAMLDTGSRYLHAVGPFYGLFGLGLALYFASQGAGRLLWPLLANLVRLVIAAGGGWLALRWGADVSYVFAALGAALAAFGLITAGAVATGAWFGPIVWPRPRVRAREGGQGHWLDDSPKTLPSGRPFAPVGCGSTSESRHSAPSSIRSRFISTRKPRATRYSGAGR
jgi:hypothetical protein